MVMFRRYEFQVYGRNKTCDLAVQEPEHCPRCKCSLKPDLMSNIAHFDNNDELVYVSIYMCTHCYHPFIGTHTNGECILVPNEPATREFDPKVAILSPDFVSVYRQALVAESLQLDEIVGVGYRRSLEFLIKDYLIHKAPDDEEKIRKMELGNCIANRIDNQQLKAVASRASWLGNDFAHYSRKFDEYEISDLKRFIDAVLYWVLMELTTEEALAIEPRK